MKTPDLMRCAFPVAVAIALLTPACSGVRSSVVPQLGPALRSEAAPRAGKGTWHMFPITGYLQGIVRTKNGDFWTADGDQTVTLSRLTVKGKVTSYTIGYQPLEMALDGAGNFWLTVAEYEKQIVRVTPSLTVSSFALTDDAGEGIALGGDGNIYFIEQTHVGRLTPKGKLTEFPTGQTGGSSGITWSGNLVWFRMPNALASLDPKTGTVKTYDAPGCNCGGAIVPAPDGSLWYTVGASTVELLRFDPKTNGLTTYTAPSDFRPYGAPAGMILAPDGALWYTVQRLAGGKIKHVAGGGLVRFDMQTKTFTTYAAPKGYDWDWDLAAGPNGTLWATSGDAVSELDPQ